MATLTDQEFLDLLEAHRHEFFRYVARTVWDRQVAEDVFSAAVLAAYQQLPKFTAGTNFRAWMYRILTNKCFVANRETQRTPADLDSIAEERLAAPESLPAAAADNPEWFLDQCGDEVQGALGSLRGPERACLMLRALERYSYQEIADILEMPVGTVMTHLARGRAKLRRRLLAYARERGVVRRLTDLEGGAGAAAGRASA